MNKQEAPHEHEEVEKDEAYYEHHRFDVDEGQEPLRIDKFLMNRMRNISRNRIQNAAKANCILVDGQAVKQNYKVKPGETISFVLPHPPRDREIKPEDIPLDIIYEDDHLLVVNKQAGMVVHPGYNNYTGTLVNALAYRYDDLPASRDVYQRPGLVHRIDKDTSGLLVLVKDEYTMTHLANQFYHHSVDRNYLALVWGDLPQEEGTIEGNLARSRNDRRKMQVYEETGIGKESITHYRVVERFGYTTLVNCWLETGRTHQVRAHMKYIGHPLFADEWYGGMNIIAGPSFSKYKQFVENCFKVCPRQALHAYSLGFEHPHTGKRMQFEQEMPEDMRLLVDKWRNYSKFKPEEYG